MRSSDVKGDNKVAEAAKEEKGNAISAEPDIDAKKAEEANKHRKLFLECGKELRYIYVIRGVGAGIIMLGTVIIFVSALLFYRQAHCDVQWSQWTPCTDLTDVSTRHRCGVTETAPCTCPKSCVDFNNGIRAISQFPKIYCSNEAVYDVSGAHFIRFDEHPQTIAMKLCN
ncbi:hypothetical protein Tcan_09850 [Toxocara canis]|uniref:Uncharacterized protein n=1 Tax=Toxocara canis TaxID=6265 RepID=A0A0B2VH44_TOXCA|nr:hypothetical protein Tcan_09850 [Toxocara canis]